nr:MAG TPA: hypothetical protein [Caudoviricetes sp.]
MASTGAPASTPRPTPISARIVRAGAVPANR